MPSKENGNSKLMQPTLRKGHPSWSTALICKNMLESYWLGGGFLLHAINNRGKAMASVIF